MLHLFIVDDFFAGVQRSATVRSGSASFKSTGVDQSHPSQLIASRIYPVRRTEERSHCLLRCHRQSAAHGLDFHLSYCSCEEIFIRPT